MSTRFVGRGAELDALAQRILFSEGGSFLITGYRGVGKTSFVNQSIRHLAKALPWAEAYLKQTRILSIRMNISRPLSPGELMHQIVRRLYEKLQEEQLDNLIDRDLWNEIREAYWRTSFSITRKAGDQMEGGIEVGDVSPLAWFKLGLSAKRSRSRDVEAAYLGYDEKAAEHDIIRLTQRLQRGYTQRSRKWRFPWKTHPAPASVRLKIIFVFDELDKLEEVASNKNSKRPFIDDILGNLKNLFTTSGICFVFVAGRDLQERWLEDVSKGDSIYESVFSYDKYLCCLWEESKDLCEALVDREGLTAGELSALNDFEKYVAFRGRGIPRRILRTLNEHVIWLASGPAIVLHPHERRRVQCYAELHQILEANDERLFGSGRGESRRTQNDRRRLGAFYLVDWILSRGTQPFTAASAIEAAEKMNTKITFSADFAGALIGETIDILVKGEFLIPVQAAADQARVVESLVAAYRIVPRRLTALAGDPDSAERSSFTEFTDPTEPASTSEIAGRYKISEKLGEGGMGLVYRALDTVLKRTVALKVLHPWLSNNPDAVARFNREMDLLERLRHPNIVAILDRGSENGRLYIAMELLDGVDLDRILAAVGRLKTNEAVAIGRQVAEAVTYIHGQGVIRNDIKPSNVRVGTDGRIRLLDFGISKSLYSGDKTITQEGGPIGTPYYMSPEQALGKPLDARSDVYSFGVMIFELLAGKRPFPADDVMAAMAAHITRDPDPLPSDLDIPHELGLLVMRCLEKQPSDRPDMSDIANLFKQFSDPATNLAELARRGERAASSRAVAAAAFTRVDQTGFFGTSVAEPPPLQAAPPPQRISVPGKGIAILSWRAGDDPSATCITSSFYFENDVITIGRDADNVLALLDDDMLSRYQARISRDGDSFFIEDLKSVNGTFVNGQRVTGRQAITPNDTIGMGFWYLKIQTA